MQDCCDFSLPHLHSMPPLGRGGSRRNIAMPSRTEKLEWCGYPTVKEFWRYVYFVWHNARTRRTHTHRERETHRHRMTAISRACIASRGKKRRCAVPNKIYYCYCFALVGVDRIDCFRKHCIYIQWNYSAAPALLGAGKLPFGSWTNNVLSTTCN